MCVMRMVDAEFEYTYEYQGNAAKLVHTPLTDKCYLTLTQGLMLFWINFTKFKTLAFYREKKGVETYLHYIFLDQRTEICIAFIKSQEILLECFLSYMFDKKGCFAQVCTWDLEGTPMARQVQAKQSLWKHWEACLVDRCLFSTVTR